MIHYGSHQQEGGMMTYPDDSIQSSVDVWWEKDESNQIQRGSLIYAFLPHVDQIPITLTPEGRKTPEDHSSGDIFIQPLRINDKRPKKDLPVAALSLHDKELWTAYRAKKRPGLVIGNETPVVDNSVRSGMPHRMTAPTILVAPYYGIDRDGSRAGCNPEFVERTRHAIYPQFFWDKLPIPGPDESLLRFDHIQPVGSHYYSYELSGFKLNDDALELVIDDWLTWLLWGGLPDNSLIIDFQKDIVPNYHRPIH